MPSRLWALKLINININKYTSEITSKWAKIQLFMFMSKVNPGTLPSTQNTFSVLLDSFCTVTAMITKRDKSQNATARIPQLSQFVTVAYGHESEKSHFELSQNATVTNCNNWGILAVAFCDLSHFVIMAVTAQTESNNTENVFWVLGRVPMFTFDMNMKSFIFAHFGVISLLYLFVCMYISYKAHNRFTKETLLIVSDVDVYMFPVLRSIPSCTTDMNLRSCILNRHKMRQSQIATIEESLPSHFVICRILWSWPWRHKLSPITLKTCSGYLGEYPCSLLAWIWKVPFLPILGLFHCYICLCVCISVIKPIIDLQRKPYW